MAFRAIFTISGSNAAPALAADGFRSGSIRARFNASGIRPLFTERDIQGMSKAFNLGSYDDVKTHADAIYDRIRGIGGTVMPPLPPRGEGPWPQSRIELFAKWMSDGFHP